MPRRGDSVAKATDLFTIHSSLFTKKLSLFHIGWYFEEVPTVNPSVKNQRFLPAPFSKGAFGVHRPKPPLSKGGASACRGGGIPQAKPGNFLPITYSLFAKKLSLFHIGWYFGKVPTVNPSVKNQRFLPAPFGKGAFGCGIDTGRVREVAIRRKPPCAMTAAARRPFGKGAFGCAADTGWGREVTNCRKPPAFAGGLFLWKL